MKFSSCISYFTCSLTRPLILSFDCAVYDQNKTIKLKYGRGLSASLLSSENQASPKHDSIFCCIIMKYITTLLILVCLYLTMTLF